MTPVGASLSLKGGAGQEQASPCRAGCKTQAAGYSSQTPAALPAHGRPGLHQRSRGIPGSPPGAGEIQGAGPLTITCAIFGGVESPTSLYLPRKIDVSSDHFLGFPSLSTRRCTRLADCKAKERKGETETVSRAGRQHPSHWLLRRDTAGKGSTATDALVSLGRGQAKPRPIRADTILRT